MSNFEVKVYCNNPVAESNIPGLFSSSLVIRHSFFKRALPMLDRILDFKS